MKFFTRLRFRRRPVTPNPTLINALVTDTTSTPDAGMRNLEVAELESSSSGLQETQPDEVNDDDCVGLSTAPANVVGEVNSSISSTAMSVVDCPPVDDCCPICFGDFIAPCRAPCGHWYCGGCILEYWNHVAAFRPCKCPMCSCQITRLTPQPSPYQEDNVELCEVLKNIQQYNHLFIGGIYGFLLKILQLPLFMRRVLQAMMDPDRPAAYLGRLRLFANERHNLFMIMNNSWQSFGTDGVFKVFLGALYTLSPFDFLPTDFCLLQVLFRHLQEKLLVTEAKLKESHYQLAVWRSDVNTNFAQSPFHTTGKNGLELVPQRAYADGQMPISPDPLLAREWDIPGHQIGLSGGIGRNLEPDELGRYSPLGGRNTTSLGIPAQLDVDHGNMHPANRNEETTNKQVTFSDIVGTNDIDDVDLEGRQSEGEALVNLASKTSAYTTALEDPSSSYSLYLPPVLEEPSSSFSEAAGEDPFPAVESLQISGEAFPGRELQASGYSLNGTTSCNFEWVRHMEDGSVYYIEGAKQPNYLVTADDVDAYLAIEVQPMDNRKRKGDLVKVFANEHGKIMCDPEMQNHIEKTLFSGHASYKLSLWTGYLDIWEPATLAIKRVGYSIKGRGSSGTVVTEKFSQSTTVIVPCENPIEFSIIDSGGNERRLRAEDNTSDISCSRDTIVLTLRFFIKRAGDKKKGKKRVLFFN